MRLVDSFYSQGTPRIRGSCNEGWAYGCGLKERSWSIGCTPLMRASYIGFRLQAGGPEREDKQLR